MCTDGSIVVAVTGHYDNDGHHYSLDYGATWAGGSTLDTL